MTYRETRNEFNSKEAENDLVKQEVTEYALRDKYGTLAESFDYHPEKKEVVFAELSFRDTLYVLQKVVFEYPAFKY